MMFMMIHCGSSSFFITYIFGADI
uniref:Uncharacterized protein n=1 Tax=Anguilla anguilla TaxID=7936 RepID=A0A0E9T9H6_ANGAN